MDIPPHKRTAIADKRKSKSKPNSMNVLPSKSKPISKPLGYSSSDHTMRVISVAHRRQEAGNRNSSSRRIRSNLLHKLGIKNVTPDCERPFYDRLLLGGVQAHREPLKYQQDKENSENSTFWKSIFTPASVSPPEPSSECSAHETKKSSKIAFDNDVSVVLIPMRSEYSGRVKERLWSNAHEIKFNAHRNTIEFASEGWDWRTTVEDDDMFVDGHSGEKVHPIHVEYDYMDDSTQ